MGWAGVGSGVIGKVISTPMGRCFRREIGDMAGEMRDMCGGNVCVGDGGGGGDGGESVGGGGCGT